MRARTEGFLVGQNFVDDKLHRERSFSVYEVRRTNRARFSGSCGGSLLF
jgi:hypothetical protein